jgi:integrase/recombinase XerD
VAGQPSARATAPSTRLASIARFEPGYRSRIRYAEAEYFSLPLKETAALAGQEVVGHRVGAAGSRANADRNRHPEARQRADRLHAPQRHAGHAIASKRLKHIDVSQQRIEQRAAEMRPKASKSMITSFFPVGDDIL